MDVDVGSAAGGVARVDVLGRAVDVEVPAGASVVILPVSKGKFDPSIFDETLQIKMEAELQRAGDRAGLDDALREGITRVRTASGDFRTVRRVWASDPAASGSGSHC